MVERQSDGYGWAIHACLAQLLDVSEAEADRLVANWRQSHPAVSDWNPVGEQHVPPLSIACELALPTSRRADRVRRANEVRSARRAQYEAIMAEVTGVGKSPVNDPLPRLAARVGTGGRKARQPATQPVRVD